MQAAIPAFNRLSREDSKFDAYLTQRDPDSKHQMREGRGDQSQCAGGSLLGLFCPWPAPLEVQGSSFSPRTMNESLQAPCSLPLPGPLSESLEPNVPSCPGPPPHSSACGSSVLSVNLLHSLLLLQAHSCLLTTVSPPGDNLCLPSNLIFHCADRMFLTNSKSFLKPPECSLTTLLRHGLCLFSRLWALPWLPSTPAAG